MIIIATQLRNSCPLCKQSFGLYYLPVYDEDRESSRNYKVNQILRSKFTGTEKPRSIRQMGLYWAACKFTADNLDQLNPKWRHWNSKDNVDFQLRVALDFRNKKVLAVSADGSVAFRYKSIAFRNLKHIMACGYFTEAFELMASVLGMDDDKFIAAVKSTMMGTP